MAQSDLFQVATHPHPTSQGTVQLPIFYYDVSALLAYFLADLRYARSILAGTGLVPLNFFGHAICGVALYDYVKTSIGSYQEVGLAITVLPQGKKHLPAMLPLTSLLASAKRRSLGFFVVDLPVTTPEANAAGKELWGYPKFVTQIQLQHEKNHYSGTVCDPEAKHEPILTLAGRIGKSVPMPGFDLVLYSQHNRKDLRTIVDVQAKFDTTLRHNLTLNVGNSTHRMAQNLKNLGLDAKKPFLIQFSGWFQTRLNAGQPTQFT